MTTKQKFARGAGISSVVVAIIAAAGAAGYNLSISKPAAANTPGFDASAYIAREEFNDIRKYDRAEYFATVQELRDSMKETRDDVSDIKNFLMDRGQRMETAHK